MEKRFLYDVMSSRCGITWTVHLTDASASNAARRAIAQRENIGASLDDMIDAVVSVNGCTLKQPRQHMMRGLARSCRVS